MTPDNRDKTPSFMDFSMFYVGQNPKQSGGFWA